MALLIRGGRIITATDDYVADVYCADETITRIEPSIEPKSLPPKDLEVIDAAGKYVFPGFIDPHVHIHLPFMGTNAADDYESASKAALAGGTTTVIEMICPGPADEPWDAFETWKSKADGISAMDYTFHMSVVRFDESARQQLRKIVDAGVASFKVFLAYKGALDLSDEDLFAAMKLARELGVIVTAHCENAEAIDAMQKSLLAEGKTGPEWHGASRPPVIEGSGVHHICAFAELLGTISTILREQEVTAEPFLLIGIIAVVRRVLAVTASIEQSLGTPEFDRLLAELGVLTVLVISLSLAPYFTRRAGRRE